MRKTNGNVSAGMRTSPWIILGSTTILLVVVLVLAFQNTNRERRYMSELLSANGAAILYLLPILGLLLGAFAGDWASDAHGLTGSLGAIGGAAAGLFRPSLTRNESIIWSK